MKVQTKKIDKENKLSKDIRKLDFIHKISSKAVGIATCLFATLLFPVASQAQQANATASKTIEGVAVTGFNKRVGLPVWDLGAPLGDMGFNFVFGYNPEGSTPNDLSPTSTMDTLLVSGLSTQSRNVPFSPK